VVEQGTHKPLVGGSNPPSATNHDSAQPESRGWQRAVVHWAGVALSAVGPLAGLTFAGLSAGDPGAVRAGIAVAVGSGAMAGLLLGAVNRGIRGLGWSSIGPILLLLLVVYSELDEQRGQLISALRPWFLGALLPVEAGYVAARTAARTAARLFRARA
jgi:hypothetical protein